MVQWEQFGEEAMAVALAEKKLFLLDMDGTI